MADATPNQLLWFGLGSLVVAGWLAWTVWSGMPGWSVPPLIGYLVAGAFGAVGANLLLQRAGQPKLAGFMVVLFALGLAGIGAWIGFGPGARACTANGFAMGELPCRVVFGGGAVVTVGIAVVVLRWVVRNKKS